MLRLLSVLERWFDFLEQQKLRLPLDFDNNLFLNLVMLIFERDHAYATGKCLNFWYTYYNIFSEDFNLKLWSVVLGKFFFRLFLHWNKGIREIFFFFICYRLLFAFELSQDGGLLPLLLLIEKKILSICHVSTCYRRAHTQWHTFKKMARLKRGGYSTFLRQLASDVSLDLKYQNFARPAKTPHSVTIPSVAGPQTSLRPSDQKSNTSYFNLSKMGKIRDPSDMWIRKSSFEKYSAKFASLKRESSQKKGPQPQIPDYVEVKKVTGLGRTGEKVFGASISADQFAYCPPAVREFSLIFQDFYRAFKLERQDLETVFVDFCIPFDRGDFEFDLEEDW